MKMCRLTTVILAGVFVAAFGIQAHAAQPSIYRYQGLGAAAYYFSVDESGCINTYVFVQFGEATSGSPSNQIQQPTLAYMNIMQFDTCTGVFKSSQTNPPALLPAGAVQIDPSLKSASLTATIDLVDDSGSPFSANVSITWTATGEFYRYIKHDHYKTAWGFSQASTRSLSRDATASGSVIVDGVNLTPSLWTGQAWIQQQIEGSITIFGNP